MFIIQFLLVILKKSGVVDWNWSSIISISFIALIFYFVGLTCLVVMTFIKILGVIIKRKCDDEGRI